jgi:hypothetical protein
MKKRTQAKQATEAPADKRPLSQLSRWAIQNADKGADKRWLTARLDGKPLTPQELVDRDAPRTPEEMVKVLAMMLIVHRAETAIAAHQLHCAIVTDEGARLANRRIETLAAQRLREYGARLKGAQSHLLILKTYQAVCAEAKPGDSRRFLIQRTKKRLSQGRRCSERNIKRITAGL